MMKPTRDLSDVPEGLARGEWFQASRVNRRRYLRELEQGGKPVLRKTKAQCRVLGIAYESQPIQREKAKPAKKRVKRVEANELKAIGYGDFLESEYWKAVRLLVLERDGSACQKCKTQEGQLHVHHKTYKNHGREHRHLGDLVTLCNLCHEKEHGL